MNRSRLPVVSWVASSIVVFAVSVRLLSFTASAGSGAAPPERMVDLDFGKGFFLAAATNGVFALSSDAVRWQRLRSGLSGSYFRISFLEDEFGALVNTSAGTELATSPDGVQWTVRVPARKDTLFGVVKANGAYVAVGSRDFNGVILTSTNGAAWQRAYTTPLPVYGIAYGNGVFVAACGHTGGIFSSDDAVTWTQRMPETTGAYQAAAFGDGRFVAVGFDKQLPGGGEMASSSDGINWERHNSAMASVLTSVCHGMGLFVAGGFAARAVSKDGLSLEVARLESEWNAVAFGNGKFVALSVDESVHVSTDGRAWEKLGLTDLYAPSIEMSTNTAGEGGLNVSLLGRPGKQYAIEASPDLVLWQPLITSPVGFSSITLSPTGRRKYLRGKLIPP